MSASPVSSPETLSAKMPLRDALVHLRDCAEANYRDDANRDSQLVAGFAALAIGAWDDGFKSGLRAALLGEKP